MQQQLPTPALPDPASPHPAIAVLLASFAGSLFFSPALANLLALPITGLALWSWSRHRWTSILRTPVTAILGALFAWAFLRDLAAGAGTTEALAQLNDLRALAFIVVWAPLFAAPLHRKAVVFTLAAGFCIFAIAALVLKVVTGQPMNAASFKRSADIAGPIMVVFIIGGVQLSISRKGWLSWLAGGVAMLLLVGLFLGSDRRTSQLCVIACGIALAVLNAGTGRRGLAVLLAAMVLPVVLLAVSPPARERMLLVVQEAEQFASASPEGKGRATTSSGLRLRFWQVTGSVIRAHPVAGTGLSGFPVVYGQHDATLGGTGVPWRNPHNEYLYMWGALGLPGILLYTGFAVALAIRARRFPDPAQRRIVWVGALAFFCSVLANSLVVDMVAGHFFMLFVLCTTWYPWLPTSQRGDET